MGARFLAGLVTVSLVGAAYAEPGHRTLAAPPVNQTSGVAAVTGGNPVPLNTEQCRSGLAHLTLADSSRKACLEKTAHVPEQQPTMSAQGERCEIPIVGQLFHRVPIVGPVISGLGHGVGAVLGQSCRT